MVGGTSDKTIWKPVLKNYFQLAYPLMLDYNAQFQKHTFTFTVSLISMKYLIKNQLVPPFLSLAVV